jgi:hypothetical protein
MQLLSEHLTALDRAKQKTKYSHFEITPKKLEALQSKIEKHTALHDSEIVVKELVWGDNIYKEALSEARFSYLNTMKRQGLSEIDAKHLEKLQEKILNHETLSVSELNLKKKVWKDNFFSAFLTLKRTQFMNTTPEPLVLAYFRNEVGVTEFFKNENKQLSLEFGDLIFGLCDQFFTDSLLSEIVDQLKTNRLVGQFIKNQEEMPQTLFPFLKQVILRNFFAHQMQGDHKQQGWYQKIIQFLSKEGMSHFFTEFVIPVIKDSYLEFLLEKVISDNPALLKCPSLHEGEEDQRVQNIFAVCTDTYSNIDVSFKKLIEDTLKKYDVFIKKAPPANSVQEKQSAKLFFESIYPGEHIKAYATLSKQVLFDFGGLPWWLKWILSFFESLISNYLTASLFPYRKTPEFIAKSIKTKIQEKYNSPNQIDALFNKTLNLNSGKNLDESIDDLAKLIFATATHKASSFKWAFMRITLGYQGGAVASIFKNAIKNTVLQGSEINMSLLFKLTKLLNEKAKSIKHETTAETVSSNLDDQWWFDFMDGLERKE